MKTLEEYFADYKKIKDSIKRMKPSDNWQSFEAEQRKMEYLVQGAILELRIKRTDFFYKMEVWEKEQGFKEKPKNIGVFV